ncbi:hypothetical protein [Bradymonas sediminis]|uniref:Uncharacterized protein n=1 Tax=Bradymonas sediminis TaxID=1548548 RepID=A0A2Z4FR25_9DELT|nr:hypothetical protein [Bradymonas sediminis]AWV91076.1 hypothetical protein DN745_17760 [Bradymonas sediminis]TDP75182.1 hypothetical protein DFR33_10446 [Bradymonas sediminis]
MKNILGTIAALVCLVSVMAVGGVHTQVAIAVVLVALPAVFYVIISSAKPNKKTGASTPISVSLPSLIFSIFAFICFLQILPLPPQIQEILSPQARALYLESLTVLEGAEAVSAAEDLWRPLSLDPRETADRGLRWIALALLALVGARLSRERHAWRDTLRAGVVFGWLHLGVSWLHNVFGATTFFGVYEPLGNWPAFTMFVNSNQGAAFYGLASLAGLILARRNLKTKPIEAFLSGVSAIIFVLFMLELNSSGVNLAYSLASILYIAQSIWMVYRVAHPKMQTDGQDSSSKEQLKTRLLQSASTLVTLGLMSAIITLPMWLSRTFLWPWVQSTPVGIWVENKAVARLVMIESGMRGALDYPILGSGAGSIERTIAPYIDWTQIRAASIPTLENQFADWFMGMGFLPTIAALALFLSGFTFISKKTRIFSPTIKSPRSAQRYLGLLAFAIYAGTLVQMHFPFFALGLATCIVVVFEVGLKGGRLKNPPEGAVWLRVRNLHIFASQRVALGLLGASVLAAGVFALTWSNLEDTRAVEIGARAQAASQEELRQMVSAVPTESRIFTALAFQAAQADEGARAIALAEHAFALEPRANELLFLAHIEAHFGKKATAADYYTRLFSPEYLYTMHSLRGWVSEYLLKDITDTTQRVQALQGAPAHWAYALSHIRRLDDKTRAVEFALELAEQNPDNFLANRLVVEAYLGAKEFLIAQFWAEMMVAKDWPAESPAPQELDSRFKKVGQETFDSHHEDPHSASLALVAHAISRSGDRDGARRYLLSIEVPESGELADEVVYTTLQLLPAEPSEATPEEVAFIARASKSYCRNQRARNEQLLCWQAEAWLDEQRGNIDDAELVWKRIASDYENPLPLGEFFVRQRQCIALDQLIAQHKETRSRPATRWLGRLRSMPRRCAAK